MTTNFSDPGVQSGAQLMLLTDSWYNHTTNLGHPDNDSARDLQFQASTLRWTQKARLYDRDWIVRKIVRKLPETAWQDQIVIEDKASAARWREVNFLHGNDDGAVLNAAVMARLFGGALLLKGYTSGGGSLEAPVVDPDSQQLEFLDVIPSPYVTVNAAADLYSDVGNPRKFQFPEWYRITDGRYRSQRIHESRVIPFYGPSAAPYNVSLINDRERDPRLARWGNSIVDILHDVASNYGITWASVSRLIQETSLVWFKMAGLFDMIKANNLNVINQRLSAMSVARGPNRTLMLDAGTEEEIGRLAVEYGGLDKVLHQLSTTVCAALDIPMNVFFGSVVGGLNASSDADIKLWHAMVTAYRTRTLEPRLEQLMKLLKITEWHFQELDQPTRKEKQEANESRSKVLKFGFDAGALDTETITEDLAERLELDVEKVKKRLAKEEKVSEAREAEMREQMALVGNPPDPNAPAPPGNQPPAPPGEGNEE